MYTNPHHTGHWKGAPFWHFKRAYSKKGVLLVASPVNGKLLQTRAANPSLVLSVMKPDFKCNNWSLCVMHMFRSVNRTWDHTIKHANRTNREVNAADTRLYLGEDFAILGYFSMYLSLSVYCMNFWICLLKAKGPFWQPFTLAGWQWTKKTASGHKATH